MNTQFKVSMTKSLMVALLGSAVAAPAFATDVTIRDFAGVIEIIEGDANLDVLQQGSEGDLNYSISDSEILIDGGLSRKDRQRVCSGGGGISWNLSMGDWKSNGDSRLKDYPHIEVKVPAGSNLIIRDSITKLDVDVAIGEADLQLAGCFDAELGDVNRLLIEKYGAGDLSAERVNRADIEKSGAGDLELETVGVFELEQSGAGDVEINQVTERAVIEKSGAGDVEIDDLDGDFTVEKSGAGDVDVGGGDIPKLSIRNSGAGDVDINAAVGDAFVRASGAGDVYIDSISGSLDESTSGAADFERGDD